jgi:hypothetical protein
MVAGNNHSVLYLCFLRNSKNHHNTKEAANASLPALANFQYLNIPKGLPYGSLVAEEHLKDFLQLWHAALG